ncbi:hypothetical protein [Streptomyces sp. NPDC059828]|uniref:hypothetical protein n=1 Tax=Streptomyces sp. NPDC059828 TaxID=3346965 RepID=UPI0036661764
MRSDVRMRSTHAMLEWLGLRSATEFAPDRFTPDEAERAAPEHHGTMKDELSDRATTPGTHW